MTRMLLVLLSAAALFGMPLACAQRGEDEARSDATVPGFRMFRHPLGFAFQHPETWSVRETDMGLQVIPPDAKRSAAGPTEYYAFLAQPVAAGITRADDPLVRRHLETAIRRLLPFLRPVGEPASRRFGDRVGAEFTWRGRNPTGDAATGKVYGILLDRYYVALVAIALDDRLHGREEALRAMCGTVALEKPTVDPRLVGIWYHTSYHSSGLGVRDRLNLSSTRRMVLLPDGTCHAGGHTAVSGTVRDPSGTGGTSLTALAEGCTEHGRWAAANGRIHVLWDDGSAGAFAVHLQGVRGRREILLTAPGGHKQLWTEYAD